MSQPVLRLNATKTKAGTVANAGAHRSSFGSSFPNAELLAQLVDMGYSVKKAGKALTETNNKDLATALDWLEVHQYEEDDFYDEMDDPTLPAAPVMVAGGATAPAAAEPLESRLKSDSREAFLERQRLKELEEVRKEKLEKQKREEEIRRQVEEEKRRRQAGSGSAVTVPSGPHHDSEEAKRQFELKQRQKEAEEAKKKRQAEIEDRERIRREMEAEKEQRAAKLGLHTKSSSSAAAQAQAGSASTAESEAQKRKQEWLREKQEEAAVKERLRQQLEEDKAIRAGKTKTPEQLAEEQRKAKEAQLELANARRARLGLPLLTSLETNEEPSPQQPSPVQPTSGLEQTQSLADLAAVREARMRSLLANQGKPEPQVPKIQPSPAPAAVQEATKPDLAELARLRAQRAAHLQKVADGSATLQAGQENSSGGQHINVSEDPQLAALRAQREANLARLLQQSAVQASEIAQMEVDSDSNAQGAPTAECVINFRMPDGRSVVGEFSAAEKYKTVYDYAAAFMPLGTIFNLMVPFPRHEFEQSDFDKTVAELGLTPRAAVTVLTLDLRGVVMQGSGPVYAEGDEMDVDNMDYEDLLRLEQQMGSVRAGLVASQISRLPSCKYSPETHSSHLCAICREDFDSQRMITELSCRHLFHTSPCVTLWLRDHKTCPVCKQTVQVPPPAQQQQPQ